MTTLTQHDKTALSDLSDRLADGTMLYDVDNEHRQAIAALIWVYIHTTEQGKAHLLRALCMEVVSLE